MLQSRPIAAPASGQTETSLLGLLVVVVEVKIETSWSLEGFPGR